MNRKELLPLGSIVLLDEGIQKLMIIGRGVIYADQETGLDQFNDYMAVMYPSGMDPNATIFFNHEDIDKVIFTGYSDEDELRFQEIYQKWKDELVNNNQL